MKQRKPPKTRNPIARCCRVNVPKIVPAKKGKGAVYKRARKIDHDYS